MDESSQRIQHEKCLISGLRADTCDESCCSAVSWEHLTRCRAAGSSVFIPFSVSVDLESLFIYGFNSASVALFINPVNSFNVAGFVGGDDLKIAVLFHTVEAARWRPAPPHAPSWSDLRRRSPEQVAAPSSSISDKRL